MEVDNYTFAPFVAHKVIVENDVLSENVMSNEGSECVVVAKSGFGREPFAANEDFSTKWKYL